MPPVKPVSSIERTVECTVERTVLSSPPSRNTIADAIGQAIADLKEDDFHTQWESAKRLSRQVDRWGDRAVPYLIDHLQTTASADIQWFLVRILGQFDQIEVIEAIAQLLTTTQSEDLQVAIRKALTRIGHSAIETVKALLAPENPVERRILAARVLACIRRTATVEPLLSVTKDSSAEIRLIAVEALGSFHDPRVTPVLLAALEEDYAEAKSGSARAAKTEMSICIEAIRTLGRRSDLLPHTNLVDPLQRCLQRDEPIAKESAIALGRLGTDQAAIALGTALMQPIATSVKGTIIRALGWIDSSRSVQSLAIAFRQSAPLIMPAIKPDIARALGQTRSPALKSQAAQPLIDWLQMCQSRLAADDSTAGNSTASDYTADSTADFPAGFSQASFGQASFATADFSQLNDQTALARAIVLALARLGESTAIEVLIPLLASSNKQIEMHVLSALHQIDREQAEAELQRYLSNEEESIEIKNKVRASLKAW